MKSQSFTATIKKGSKELYLSSGQDTIAKNGAFVKIGKNEICYQIESYTSLELKKKFEEQYKKDEDKKEKMSSQKPARKPLKHNPEKNNTPTVHTYADNRSATMLDRVFNKLSK